MKRSILTLLFVLGCTSPLSFGEDYFVNLRPMVVPAVYAEWYSQTAQCIGLAGRFSDVEWFTADRIHDSDTVPGTWGGNMIVIRSDALMRTRVVRHESAHHITGKGSEIHFENGLRASCDGGP